ncbi:hypothetical protein A3D78_05445 [Candidatus Gottesmanbacteria bacterium RIFCSPHIGHO2_02_FULL_39_14]|uniref:Transposase IS200-like domain-containing protein n=1 Tax=Candidatus Gottesmanbacteria bacterium RIFCSPHIGHO2_02_FULL_39_14 TaxID=1798383 RepID=A0A1F6A3R2_9BACT|nr:MAG: hypothetical protein A3D78_05445 [Candidatus Gottesmanbacteria bacterium RIFCSPHIGHO2_02_FULL_39_14]
MPSKNIVKQYLENGIYHIYNRGVEKRIIFKDKKDCIVFLHYLKLYLSPVNDLLEDKTKILRMNRYIRKNLSSEINLIAFALMPNHIHLIIKQFSLNGIVKLMQRLTTAYVMYFNKKYQRIGSLFQNTYKAVLIEKDEYLLHLSRYIHLNPMKDNLAAKFSEFSSYSYFLGDKKVSWVKPKVILDYFKSAKKEGKYRFNSYQSFVEDYKIEPEKIVGDLKLEDEY